MRKSAIIRDLQVELASRNRDLWILTDQNADLRDHVRVLEAVGVEQEREILDLKALIESWNVSRDTLEELCRLQRSKPQHPSPTR